MDLKTSVYNAAADGDLDQLKKYLDGKTSSEIEDIICSLTNGATPLVIACRNGHFDVAHYLIMDCHAVVDQVGAVTFDGETIQGAPALWCAAAAGNLKLVKLLVSQGAKVNCTTESNSTPLRAACFDGHFDIVTYLIQHGADIEIANKHGHTSLMIACYQSHYLIVKYLLDCGADVNKRTVKGSTALHDCAESGSLLILKMLMNRNAKFEADLCGTTPLLSAAISGNAVVVEYFIQYFNCSKLDKINALELLGATDIDMRRNMFAGLKCWRRAMNMRYEDPRSLLLKPDSETPFSEYIQSTEVKTLAQLEELRSDPDELRIQALLVRERILGPTHPHTVNFLRLRGAVYANSGSFEKCIKLWTYALDVQQRSSDPVSPLTQSILLSFVELFSCMMPNAQGRERYMPIVPFCYVLDIFERSLQVLEKAMDISRRQQECSDVGGHFHRTLSIVMHMAELLCQLLPGLSEVEVLRLKQAVYRFVHLNPRGKNNCTPLHLACSKSPCMAVRHTVCRFPSQAVTELLLEVGESPNSVDFDGNTALHLIASIKPCPMNLFKTLLSRGAHLDLSNIHRMTPLHLIQNAPISDLYPLQYINLQCLCARAVRSYNVPYEGMVHESLERFLDLH
ncbi:protein fem-1 homolog C-like [Uloborus diversus]|uniref:protein fem-1 homolog C-like n=1 Tax=Uloborus diversus TaxID=327109 RepID=UPI00240A550A|nr:protein fem-1 homolog C-like [Uloborus diversus]